MNPKKKQDEKRAGRRRAVKKSKKKGSQEWKGTDPASRDAVRKVQRLFAPVLNGTGR